MIVALLRHGRTEWNDARRMQGRADIPLSDAGRAQVAAWQLPAAIAEAKVVASPLARALETARLLTAGEPRVEPDLIEMDWGAWEGRTFDELRAELGPVYALSESLGVDYRPPGGESPRDVQVRVERWFAGLPEGEGPVVAVTHQGVLRALVAKLTGWDMVSKPPVKLLPDRVHLFEAERGHVRAVEWNVALVAGDRAPPVHASRAPRHAPGRSR
jgi:probable phosphoglycerate mutase